MELSLLIFIGFVVLLLLVSFYFSKKRTSSINDDFFLSDRSLNKYLISISAGATANTGFIVTGAVGFGYKNGISSLLMPLSWFLGELTFWYFFPHRINSLSKKNDLKTISQFLTYDMPKGRKLVQILASIILTSATIIYVITQWNASAVAFASFYDISNIYGILISGGIVTSYCLFAGFRSSVTANVVQGFFMILLTTVALIFCLYKIGGLQNLFNNPIFSQNGFDNLFNRFTLLSASAYIIGWACAGVGFGLSQPQIIDKYFAGKSESEVKNAKWLYLVFVQYTWVGMTFLGVIIKCIITELPDSEAALPKLVAQFSNQPLKGLVVVGVFATIASTADSLIIAISNSLKNDILKTIFPKKIFPKHFDRLLTLIVSIITIFLSMLLLKYSVFDLAVFAILLAAIISPAMIIKVLRLHNNSISIFVCLVMATIAALTWKFLLKYDSAMNQTIIGIITGLAFNYITYALTREFNNSKNEQEKNGVSNLQNSF